MKIQNHWLSATTQSEQIVKDKSPNVGAKFRENLLDMIVIHYTAGSSLDSSVNWLKNKAAKASAHLVIGKSGKIVQLVPFDTIAWHAGKSKWFGREGLNAFSIGIELDNAGLLQKRNSGYYTHFGKKVNDNNVVFATHKHNDEEQAWEAYTEKQLEMLEKVCLLLKSTYALQEMVGHEDIAKGRKTDPGPAFPMGMMYQKIMEGRAGSSDVQDDNHQTSFDGLVKASKLNVREKPNTDADKIAWLPQSKEVRVLKRKGDWYKISFSKEGWVSSKYILPKK